MKRATSRSTLFEKWRRSWYELLDVDRRHLLHVGFDFFRKTIRIKTPVKGGGFRVFHYHIDTDTCWPDENFSPTVFGRQDVDVFAGETWDTLAAAGTTWDDLNGRSWDSLLPRPGLEEVFHGDANGNVFVTDSAVSTYDGVEQVYRYRMHDWQLSDTIYAEGTPHRFGVEYMNVGGGDMSVAHYAEGRLAGSSVLQLNETGDAENQFHTASAIFRQLGSHHAFQLAGAGPLAVRSIEGNGFVYGSRDMEGQV